MDAIGFGESMRLCVSLCLMLDNNICLLLDNNLCFLLDNNLCFLLDNSLSGHVLLNLGYWVVSTFNFHIVNRMLITCESGVGAFLLLTLL
jgi:hypothetical protein